MDESTWEARLELRPGDVELSPEQLLKISTFAGMSAGFLKKNRGAIVLRRYAKDEIVCRQGDAGWSAFYILKSEDLLAIREGDTGDEGEEELRHRVDRLTAATSATEAVAAYKAELARLDPQFGVSKVC